MDQLCSNNILIAPPRAKTTFFSINNYKIRPKDLNNNIINRKELWLPFLLQVKYRINLRKNPSTTQKPIKNP